MFFDSPSMDLEVPVPKPTSIDGFSIKNGGYYKIVLCFTKSWKSAHSLVEYVTTHPHHLARFRPLQPWVPSSSSVSRVSILALIAALHRPRLR